MANQQQVLFAETIAGMKKAFKRRAYGKAALNPQLVTRACNTDHAGRQIPTPTPTSTTTATEAKSSKEEPGSPAKAN